MIQLNYKCRILYGDNGQLCNRFWSYVGHVFWAMKHDTTVYVLTWNPNVFDYDCLINNRYLKFSFNYAPFFNLKIGSHLPVSAMLQKFFYSPSLGDKAAQLAVKYPDNFFKEWPPSYGEMQDDDIQKYKPRLRELFAPKQSIRASVNSFFEKNLRNRGKLIIGVHIRRGDYATWKDGTYFYSFEKYAELMRSILTIFQDKQVCFFVASVETIPEDLFSSFETYSIPYASASQDLYALSLCDRIIGPPSSFSRWASFINDVPIHFILSRDDRIESDMDFSSVRDQDYLQNGKFIPVELSKIEKL